MLFCFVFSQEHLRMYRKCCTKLPSAEGSSKLLALSRQTTGHATDSKSENPAKGPVYLLPPILSWSGCGIMVLTLVHKEWRVTHTSLQIKQDKTVKSLTCLSWFRSHVVLCKHLWLIFFARSIQLIVIRKKLIGSTSKKLKEKLEITLLKVFYNSRFFWSWEQW